MATTVDIITELKERVLQGGEITYDEALSLIHIQEESLLNELRKAAHEITLAFNSNKTGLCSLINAKSYLCGEDCGFCAQSVRFETSVARYELLEPEIIIGDRKSTRLNSSH